jgi:hypothetical protein
VALLILIKTKAFYVAFTDSALSGVQKEVIYLAGGYLVNDIIKFPLIDMQFHRPWVLTVFVWVMLWWFALRYWQTRKETFERYFLQKFAAFTMTNIF